MFLVSTLWYEGLRSLIVTSRRNVRQLVNCVALQISVQDLQIATRNQFFSSMHKLGDEIVLLCCLTLQRSFAQQRRGKRDDWLNFLMTPIRLIRKLYRGNFKLTLNFYSNMSKTYRISRVTLKSPLWNLQLRLFFEWRQSRVFGSFSVHTVVRFLVNGVTGHGSFGRFSFNLWSVTLSHRRLHIYLKGNNFCYKI